MFRVCCECAHGGDGGPCPSHAGGEGHLAVHLRHGGGGAVQWYKAVHEFLRYIPGDRDQRISTFNLPGITVEVGWRNTGRPKNVYLKV